ncbi:MAG TPA: Hsp20/alpha crystallin family protein [Candidatus Binatia bacterium]|nr:Hsp20/alpha crystallin family protein [Candidatus Binatia bacterium]
MALVSFRGLDPLESLMALQGDLDRLFRNPLAGFDLGPSGAPVFPPLNVFADKEGELVIKAEVPGVDPDKIDIQLEPRRLTLSGERSLPETKGSFHRRERRAGRFARAIQLPEDLDPENATAEFRNGVLTIRVAKRAIARPRRISIKAS